jgi:hypothetical protein
MKSFNESITKSASQILNQNFNKDNVFFVMENIEIDGCHKYGPTLRDYQLFILSNKDTDYVLYEYYRSVRYGEKDSEKYELVKRTILEHLKPYFIILLNDNIKHIDNINVISKIKDLYKIIKSLKIN